jgi:uncharacterized protein DUF6893
MLKLLVTVGVVAAGVGVAVVLPDIKRYMHLRTM